ncbi:MAG: aminotransferase class IV [Chloroflexi bacterium]|nr:aminotransferase class IV [Chloroflexota bacterium]
MPDYQNYEAYFNGEWVPWKEVLLSPEDRGFGVSDVVFDVARTFNGKPFVLDYHIDRLYRSLKYLRIDSGLSADEMTAICEEGVRRNEKHLEEAGDFTINPWVTRGRSLDGPATVCVAIKPVNFPSFANYYLEGAHGVVARTRSYSSDVMDPKVKHHSRLNFVMAELEARDVDPEAYAILLDMDGNMTEGIGYNVWLVKDGVLKTATDRSILQGVSRKVLMEIAEQLGVPVVEEDLQPYDLYTADEVFFSRTSPRITPVSKVDNRPVGDEFPGPITQQLLAAHSERVGVDIVGQALHHAGIQS